MVKCMPKDVPRKRQGTSVLLEDDIAPPRKLKQVKLDSYYAPAPILGSVVQTDDVTRLTDIIMKKLEDMSVITQDPPTTPPAEHAEDIATIQKMSKDELALNDPESRKKLGIAIENLLQSHVGNSACLILANNALSNIETCILQMDRLNAEENNLNDEAKKAAARSDDSVSSINDLLEDIHHKKKTVVDIVEQIQKLRHQKSILDKEINTLLTK